MNQQGKLESKEKYLEVYGNVFNISNNNLVYHFTNIKIYPLENN